MSNAALLDDPEALQARIRARVAQSETAFSQSKSPRMKELEKLERRQQRERQQAQAQAAPQPVAAVQEAPAPAPPMPPVVLLTPEEVAAIKAQGQGLPPGKLQTVSCPLEGYEGVAVTYRTNNQLGVIRNIPDSRDKPAFSAWIGLFVRRIDWPYEAPPPDISTPEGLAMFEDNMQDLMMWIISDGRLAAREQAAGPSFPVAP